MRGKTWIFSAAIAAMTLGGGASAFAGQRFDISRPAHIAVTRSHAVRRDIVRHHLETRFGVSNVAPAYGYGFDGTGLIADGNGPPACEPTTSCAPGADVGCAPAPVNPNVVRDVMDAEQARLTAQMQTNPQWVETTDANARAVADLESAQTRIEATLAQRPDYQAALAEKQAAEALADQMHAAGDNSPEDLTPLAQRDLAASQLITQLQVQALQSDPQWLAARTALRTTAEGRQAMQDQLHADLLNDPVWQAARAQLG